MEYLMQKVARRLKRMFSGSPASFTASQYQSNEGGLTAPASGEDVINCYRLILGRPPENETVIAEKVGIERQQLLHAFMFSEEFRKDTRSFLQGELDASLFEGPVTGDLRRWVHDLLLPGDHDAERLAEIQDLAPMLGFCLRYPILGDLLDAALGDGCAVELAGFADRLGKPRLKASTSREDLQNCYLLFLERAPESDLVTAERPDTPLAESVCDFIASPEFAAKVAYPAMDGRYTTHLVPSAVASWASDRLLLEATQSLDAAAIIAGALTQPAIAHALQGRRLTWVVEEVVRRLQFGAGVEAAQKLASLHERLEQIGQNVEVLASNNMEISANGHVVEFTGGDPWLILKPTGPAIEGDLMSFRFRAAIDGHATTGQLYLDYGSGFSEANSLPLVPDRDGFHKATVAAPRRLLAARWDPAASIGTASISMLEVAPLTTEAYCAEEFGDFGEAGTSKLLLRVSMEASRRPDAPAAVVLTRALSPSGDAGYTHWIARNEFQSAKGVVELKLRNEALKQRPRISVVVPVYNPPAASLAEMIASVRGQIYDNWELCIADDASTQPHVRRTLEEAAAQDHRIKVLFRPENGHICQASNSALELASGSWIAMLDHDDVLAPHALLFAAEHIAEHPEVKILYSDEDKLDERGQRFDPYFKPDFSPELLLAQNYMNHMTVVRTDLVRDAGGWRVGFEGSQDHDLIFRIVENLKPSEVGHLPYVLYHWRALTGSTALGNEQKDYVLESGRAAVRDHLERTKRRAKVEIIDQVHHYRVRHELPEERPLVSLIIPTRDKVDILKVAVDSILEKSTYDNYEILVVNNGSVQPESLKYFAEISQIAGVRVLPYPHPFNYSKINNFAAEHAKGSVIALVNNDVEVITPDWMEEMTAWAIQPEIGCVGAKLFYPDMSIQHAGVIVGIGGCAGHSHKFFPHDAAGYFNRLQVHQNLSAVTAACLFLRKDVFFEVGGLEEELSVAFNDVDLCLRVREAGYRNLFTPFAKLFHHESISRGAEDTPEKMARAAGEVRFMQSRWGRKLMVDPFYSPNLPYDREDFGINIATLRH